MAAGVVQGADGRPRCWWCGEAPEYVAYHDREWGRPVMDDVRLLEKLCLEGFQAGLSWITILRKRDAFRRAFRGFDPEAVSRFGRRDVARLLADPSIVRHRGKIEAAIGNARAMTSVRESEGSLARLVWRYEPPPAARPRKVTRAALRRLAETPASRALSKALQGHGFRFVGPTTCYAFMQAMGIVNDHLDGCALRGEVELERARAPRPD